MKKLVLVLTIHLLSFFPVFGQGVVEAPVFSGIRTERQEGDVVLSFDFRIDSGNVQKGETLVCVPVITDGRYKFSLPAIMVQDRRAVVTWERHAWLGGETALNQPAYQVKYGEDLFYQVVFDFQPWMYGARLDVESVATVCGELFPQRSLLVEDILPLLDTVPALWPETELEYQVVQEIELALASEGSYHTGDGSQGGLGSTSLSGVTGEGGVSLRQGIVTSHRIGDGSQVGSESTSSSGITGENGTLTGQGTGTSYGSESGMKKGSGALLANGIISGVSVSLGSKTPHRGGSGSGEASGVAFSAGSGGAFGLSSGFGSETSSLSGSESKNGSGSGAFHGTSEVVGMGAAGTGAKSGSLTWVGDGSSRVGGSGSQSHSQSNSQSHTTVSGEVSVPERLSEALPFILPASGFDPDAPFLFHENEQENALIIYYTISSHEIDPDYADNAQTLESLQASINLIQGDLTSKVKHVVVAGCASPEGPYEFNDRLALDRAVSVKDFVLRNTDMQDVDIKLYNGSSDWRGLRILIAQDDQVPDKAQLLDIIDNHPVWDPRKQIGRTTLMRNLNGGKAYSYIAEHLFPKLRKGAFIRVYYENEK